MMFSSFDVYEKLRASLVEYARLLCSVEIEIFAIEMELIPGTTDSADPALLDEFQKACPANVDLSEAYSVSASYVEREIVKLRHVDAAKRIVQDLLAASTHPQAPPMPLCW